MGSINQGILGGFSGKVGTVIGFVRNGVAFMRGLAIGHSDANSPAQQEQRARFSIVLNFLRPLTAQIRKGFKVAGSRASGFGLAMSYHMENAVKGIHPAFEIDYSKVLMCKGPLAGPLNATAACTEAGKIAFTWTNNDWDAAINPLDKAVLVVYNPTKQSSISVTGAATRAEGSYTVTLPAAFSGDQVHCYLGFTDDYESAFSNGAFVATLPVL